MQRLSKSGLQVIDKLIFEESFDTIRSETGFQDGVLRDELTLLLHAGFIEVTSYQSRNGRTSSRYYDADHMNLYSFRATDAGLKALKSHSSNATRTLE